ncbi:MAG: DUF2147 domain-containing protein [Cyclobacteriaceae bacterium]
MKILMTLSLLAMSYCVSAQSIAGKWKTIDDNNGKARSVVEIYEKGGKYFGKVVKLFRDEGEDPNPTCDQCKGPKKGQPIIGMEIITGMEKDGDEYEDGEILDPENGKTYDCKIWIEDGNLKVRGYLLFFYRTQTWLPAEG